ncbi:hypothetical protein NLG97_g240 [Lecanicillium saksenae]|uniref:Uncharacterized protein n=1 Tax=Lecanicillium saksenae TaxID=468837 RepID=A0ACC1RB94_9HYPO|nr:hypothetical protein NLG97_g240 [Lecanicillium saksenae]
MEPAFTHTDTQNAIHVQTDDERIMFSAIDLCPDWNECGADQATTANLSAEPNFDEFPQYTSSLRASSSERHALSAASSSTSGASPSTAVPSRPTLDIFSMPDLEDFHLSVAIAPPAIHIQSNASLAPTSSPALKMNVRRVPPSKSMSKPPTLQRRRRARAASWFD